MRPGPRHQHRHWGQGEWDWRGFHRTARPLRRQVFRHMVGAIVGTAVTMFVVGHFVTSHGGFMRPVVGVAIALLMLSAASAALARRLAWPLMQIAETAKKIGAGDLSARAQLGGHGFAEARVVADAMREMAERLEKQLNDQRALLAGASHELRTPLQHMKLLVEILRQTPSEKGLADLEREIEDVDNLVGKLLANSRLDFGKKETRALDAIDLAKRALDRCALPSALLQAQVNAAALEGDPTLLVRALENLLENARDHGAGATALKVEKAADRVTFSVEDRGPGLPPGEEAHVLDPFFHREVRPTARDDAPAHGSLGLGLHLVRRIAQAHGGDAFAHNRDDGHGARVGLYVRA